jgi:glutaryl-CoA dehydrogenase (non-decarboxylating)
VPGLCDGSLIGCLGLTEPGAGSDALGSMRTTARRDGDHYVLDGEKAFISHANHADLFLVLATIDPTLKHKGVCAFLVRRDSPGIEARPMALHVLKRGDHCLVRFEGVRVPADQLLGEEGGGFRVVGSALDVGRFSVASRCVGQAQACLDAALCYAGQREQFGQQLGRFQLVQGMLADMIASVEAARLLVRRVGQLKDAGLERASFEASMAKLYASDVCMKVAEQSVQIHGGYGLTSENPVGRYLQEAKVLQIGEGSNQLHQALVAEYALGYRHM